jgi:hypothetical protein
LRTEIKTFLLRQLCKNDFKKSLMDATAVAPYGEEKIWKDPYEHVKGIKFTFIHRFLTVN